jgi:hypothetical protein
MGRSVGPSAVVPDVKATPDASGGPSSAHATRYFQQFIEESLDRLGFD